MFALVDQGCLSASTFGTTALLAHTAGLDVLGTFSIVWMIVLLVNAAQVAIVTAPMASLAPSNPDDDPDYYAYYIGVQMKFLGGLLAASALVVGATLAATPDHAALVASALAVIVGYQVCDFVRRFAHAIARHFEAAVLSAAVAVTQLAVLAALRVAGRLTLDTALIAIAVSMGSLSAAAATRLVPRWTTSSRDHALRDRSWESSRWLLGSAVMHWTCGNLFVLLSPAYVGFGGAGALRAAQSIVGVVNVWYLGLENVIPLHAGKLWRGAGPGDAVRYVGRLSLIWTGITGLFVATIVLFADPLLLAFYGSQVAPYRWVLQWYAVLQLLIFLGLPLRSLLRAAEQTRAIFTGFVAATLFSVAAVLPLLRTYGLAGALAGLTCAQLVFQFVLALHIWRQFHQFKTVTP